MSSQPNQSLVDGLACLNALCAAGQALGGRELARRLDQHHAKTNRLLMTLASLGLVQQDAQRRYFPAGGLHVLAALAGHGSGLLRRAGPVLAELHQRWPNATLAIGVRWQDQVAYLYHAGPHASAVDALRLPKLLPCESSSIGQVLAPEFVAGPDATGHVALTHGQPQQQHRSIAVAIHEFGRPVAGLAATHISMRLKPALVAQHLHAAAAKITKRDSTDIL